MDISSQITTHYLTRIYTFIICIIRLDEDGKINIPAHWINVCTTGIC